MKIFNGFMVIILGISLQGCASQTQNQTSCFTSSLNSVEAHSHTPNVTRGRTILEGGSYTQPDFSHGEGGSGPRILFEYTAQLWD